MTWFFKENEKGVAEMCKIIEDIVNDEKAESAIAMHKDGLSFEKIANYLRITPEKVKEIIEEQSMLV